MLLSLLRQLIEGRKSIPEGIRTAFKAYQQTQRPLSIEDVRQLILDVVNSSSDNMYIVVDAMDECASPQRRVFLQALSGLTKSANAHLMITGRPHVDDFDRLFPNFAKLEISADEEDLRRYIHHELDLHSIRDVIEEDFADEVAEQLITVSCGMFLLAVLHLRTLVNMTSVGAIQDALGSLSENLSEAYGTTISRIQHLPGSRSELGMNVLQWVCFSVRPLRVEELQEVLCVKHGQTSRNAKYRPVLRILLECCQGLVLIDSETMLVRPAHYTVQEHIVDYASALFPHHGLEIVRSCLTYLTFDDFASGPLSTLREIEKRVEGYPFFHYAASYWHTHFASLPDPRDVEELLWRFLGSAGLRGTAKQVSAFVGGLVIRYWQAPECLSHTALHTACLAGLTSVVTQLLDASHPHSTQREDINVQSHIGTTPVIQAASCGYVEIVQLLLQHGADPYIENSYGNALQCAAEAGESSTIRVLVQHGMSPGSDPRYNRPPIHCTLDRDSAEAFETLLELGASIEEYTRPFLRTSEDEQCQNCGQYMDCVPGAEFLYFAVGHDAGNIIRTIARRQLVSVNTRWSKFGATPLDLARLDGRINASRALEEVGVKETTFDPNCVDPTDTALARSALGGCGHRCGCPYAKTIAFGRRKRDWMEELVTLAVEGQEQFEEGVVN